MKKKVVGIYGGTFDPPHFGHVNLAIELQEKADLDEVWVCPAFLAPHKQQKLPKASAVHRLEMTKLAFDDIAGFSTLSLEVERGGVSYTIDTLKYLHDKYPQYVFRLMIAQDSFCSFFTWKNYQEILLIAPPIIGCRNSGEKIAFSPGVQKNCLMTTTLEISSTQIRDRLKNQLYVEHLLPRKVLDYIYTHQLY